MEQADIALLACVLNGDEAGLKALMNRHWHALVRYSFSILENWDSAEGAAEEVFVQLWEHRETWGLEGSVLGLLFRITRDISLNEVRQRETQTPAGTKPRVSSVVSTSDHYRGSHDVGAKVTSAITNLQGLRREVFVLVRQHGLSYREAAETLSVEPLTVAHQFSMAMTDLRNALHASLDTTQFAGEAVGR